ncbi:response regulator transcription factor [Vibrio genomosp. F10 str. 9ZC157]|uniref:Response regulator n=2 Tax=Vibrio genomosp. F10 TaxID=723171 RepID=A0A1E5BE73_9VIBR|nr:response regulator [Vibrio genomosp. F10]OEE33794.1 response regulator [Vibrio genomosp. F10 str. ZF-129]OEE96268.1 response regulator [Vibrio genomosp. F10 str. 9ZC157]
MKVLIVDDSKATLEIVRRSLEKYPYMRLSINKADSGADALVLVEEWKPDILLTDWYMPGMTGLELIEIVTERNPDIKTAMITMVDDEQLIVKAQNAGALFVQSKPFEDEDLHQHLRPLTTTIGDKGMLGEPTEYQGDLALPQVSQLEKHMQRIVSDDMTLYMIHPQEFDETKLPCLMAMYVDSETQKPKTIALLDLQAICLFAQGNKKLTEKDFQHALDSRVVSKEILDSCHKTLTDTALAFLDNRTKKSLRLKSVSLLPHTFEKLEKLFAKGPEERVDFSCEIGDSEQGKVTLVGY